MALQLLADEFKPTTNDAFKGSRVDSTKSRIESLMKNTHGLTHYLGFSLRIGLGFQLTHL